MNQSTKMKIVVVGPGAMGCLYAARLSEGHNQVSLLDKRPTRASQIAADGVRIDANGSSHIVTVHATTDASLLSDADVVFICVKSYDTLAAIRSALPVWGPGTIAVSLQNGAGNVEKIASVVGADRVLCAITAQGATLLSPGHIRHAGAGATVLAPLQPADLHCTEIVAGLLNQAGIPSTTTADLPAIVWGKLVVNAGINPVTAIAGVPNGQLLDDDHLRTTMHSAAVEAAAVARACGVSLPYTDEIARIDEVCRATATNISSMLQDIRADRRTEIDAITGFVVDMADSAGIAVPTSRMLLDQIHDLGQGESDPVAPMSG